MIFLIEKYLCDFCVSAPICTAKSKLKPFTEEVKKDLGVTLEMKNCAFFEHEGAKSSVLEEDINEEEYED